MQSPDTFRPSFLPPVGESASEVPFRQFRHSKQSRGYGRDWEKLSLFYRTRHPICEICLVAQAVDCHHKIPFATIGDPLRLAYDNLQAVCRPCHSRVQGAIRRKLR